MVTHESFSQWMHTLGRSWVNADAKAAGALFTEEATYREDRFAEPMRGRNAIIAYWEEVPRSQRNIQFGYKVITITPDSGIAHWWASFRRIPGDAPVELDGIIVAHFDDEHRCHTFEEWWQIAEAKAESTSTTERLTD